MSRGNKLPFERGKSAYQNATVTSTDLAHLEGQVVYLSHTSPSDQKVRVSNADVVAIVVRNSSSGVLNAGNVVVWKTGKVGTQVDVTSGAAQIPAGIVDDHLPSGGVQVNDLFYLIIKGPVTATFKGGGATHASSKIYDGYPLRVSATAGHVEAADETATGSTELVQLAHSKIFAGEGGSAGTALASLSADVSSNPGKIKVIVNSYPA